MSLIPEKVFEVTNIQDHFGAFDLKVTRFLVLILKHSRSIFTIPKVIVALFVLESIIALLNFVTIANLVAI